ncbi:hypothetical protein BU23DRAFT_561096 [Bimuria novae-zelandiae CBS 107.79]|uniref:C2H2-type domain-containing protein n=1 Tax=Bimuria novae-zelandiae CBS 107.79 TaxID=1447943 RepID=A0A6A5UKH9_9PLEO|nr:hypothetical protein BU23DRAFT_561096 [Bimuria novae-zelandiae CBS 107.79]
MSSTNTASFEEIRSQEQFYPSLSTMPDSPFLSTPAMYRLETRRDSMASAPTSMSFGSCLSDYSLPVTPTHGESPLSGRGFPHVVPYELGQEMQENHSYHGVSTPSKSLVDADDVLYGSWSTSSPGVNHERQVYGSFYEPHLVHQNTYETSLAPAINNSWAHWQPIPDSEPNRQWNDHASSFSVQPSWTEQLQAPQMMMLHPSAAITEVENDYTQVASPASVEHDYIYVGPQYLSQSESFGDLGQPLVHTPQEVLFEEELSVPSVKEESDAESSALRLEPMIYESPTGGKSFKRERKVSHVSPTRTKALKGVKGRRTKVTKEKHGAFNRTVDLDSATLEYDSRIVEWDPVMKTMRAKETPGEPRPVYLCRKVCGKKFPREEHRTRHERTVHGYVHATPDKRIASEFRCELCWKVFNRSDNLAQHWQTHIVKEGCKPGRNTKHRLEEVQAFFSDPKVREKIAEMHLKNRKSKKN